MSHPLLYIAVCKYPPLLARFILTVAAPYYQMIIGLQLGPQQACDQLTGSVTHDCASGIVICLHEPHADR